MFYFYTTCIAYYSASNSGCAGRQCRRVQPSRASPAPRFTMPIPRQAQGRCGTVSPPCHLTLLSLTRAGVAGIFCRYRDALVLSVQPRLVMRGGMVAACWISRWLASPASPPSLMPHLGAEGCSRIYGYVQDRGDKRSLGARTRGSGAQHPELGAPEVAVAETCSPVPNPHSQPAPQHPPAAPRHGHPPPTLPSSGYYSA